MLVEFVHVESPSGNGRTVGGLAPFVELGCFVKMSSTSGFRRSSARCSATISTGTPCARCAVDFAFVQ
eukprot:12321322-Karenia_brevis.AAC.1